MRALDWAILESLWPAKSTFTEKECHDLEGNVFFVTGSTSGLGLALVKILYSKNATVYLGARSQKKAENAIEEIVSLHPRSSGKLIFHHLELMDLDQVRKSAEEFLKVEKKLTCLVHNAGLMVPDVGEEKTAQGYATELGVNTMAPFVLTRCLQPLLASTAATSPPNTVRIVWVASDAHYDSPLGAGGFVINESSGYAYASDAPTRYGQSKSAMIYIATEWARRYGKETGVISIALHPGWLCSDVGKNLLWVERMILKLFWAPYYGALTELYAACSPDVDASKQGAYVIPWGKFGNVRPDHRKEIAAGASGLAGQFWDWCEKATQKYCI